MSKPPDRSRRPTDPRDAAEAAFRKATAPAAAAPSRVAVPGVRQLVSLRLDQDVLEHFQESGADWQDRMNAVLRKAAFGDGG